jgi:hypothetical protein
MLTFVKNMYSFVLSILFWIFSWNMMDILIDEFKLNNKQLILFYTCSLIIITIIIYYDKDFFNYA